MKQIAVVFFTLVAGISGLWASDGTAAEKKQKETPAAAASVGDNMTVQFEYTLTVGQQIVDSSQGKGPMNYVHGRGEIIPGLEREMSGMRAGDSKEITVKPQDAYGQASPAALLEVPRTQLPQGTEPQVGMILSGRDPQGHAFQARISEIKEKSVMLDMNHPLAGKTLHFKVKVLDVSPAGPAPKE